MRYSMLVYITNMSKTLLEAARYLRTAESGPMRKELLDNGRQMLSQIETVLDRCGKDLRSDWLAGQLAAVKGQWKSQGTELESLLEEFAQRLPQEIDYQVRAVFLAELGQKWDSMESVYEAMRDDPRFDTVVVLTPVFRVVNRNGKQEQEVIYKDYLTAKGILFLGYDQYNLEEDCPDLAFICQPYEACTLKEYWPETIAKHTRLVYLNYGVTGPVFEDSAEPLCRLPVHRYAWKVPGATELHFQYYSKHAVNGGGNMIVTGLPKFDPMIRLKTKPAPIPEAWKPAVQGRKVIFWNTWYDPARSSLDCFDQIAGWLQKHDDCAVIWRLHPMMHTVAKLYYPPEVYERLQKNIAAAKAMPNMIYDDLASYETGFSCSNAQISDFSSMMFQYLLLDKPVLWIRKKGIYGPYNGEMKADEYFIDWRWMEEAWNAEEVLQFLDRIRRGQDEKADIRRLVLERDVPLADGHCGERLRETLWDSMHKEDFGI